MLLRRTPQCRSHHFRNKLRYSVITGRGTCLYDKSSERERERESTEWIVVKPLEGLWHRRHLIELSEFGFLVLQIPLTIFVAYKIAKGELASQKVGYHAARLAMLVSGMLALYLRTLIWGTEFTSVSDNSVNVFLLLCEFVMVKYELSNAKAKKKEKDPKETQIDTPPARRRVNTELRAI